MQGFSVMIGRMLAEASGTMPGVGICKIFQKSIRRRACPATLFLVNRGTAFGAVITGKPSDGLPALSRRPGQMRPWNTAWTFLFVAGGSIPSTCRQRTPRPGDQQDFHPLAERYAPYFNIPFRRCGACFSGSLPCHNDGRRADQGTGTERAQSIDGGRLEKNPRRDRTLSARMSCVCLPVGADGRAFP